MSPFSAELDSDVRIVLTRPEKQARQMLPALAQLGLAAEIFSLFEIETLDDFTLLDAALARLADFALLVFVSPNAIEAFFARLTQQNMAHPKRMQWGVMGASSLQALQIHIGTDGLERVVQPADAQKTDSESFFANLDLDHLRGKKVLIVRGSSGREFLSQALRQQGIEVELVSAYRRVFPILNQARQDQLEQLLQKQRTWIITSSEALKQLIAWCAASAIPDAVVKMQHQVLFVPHQRIAEQAQGLGCHHVHLTASGDENILLALQSRQI